MARYKDSMCRLCRKEGLKLMIKGERCFTDKCSFERRGYKPGMHRQSKAKLSDYGKQLREKQKVKRIYQMMERQFRKYFHKAEKLKGVTGYNLILLLERRLDNMVYRMGFAHSRTNAKQMIRHNHILVNEKQVNIPSYLVKVNDIVSIKKKDKMEEQVRLLVESSKHKTIPNWLEFNKENCSTKIVSLPERQDITMPISEHLIIELYSK